MTTFVIPFHRRGIAFGEDFWLWVEQALEHLSMAKRDVYSTHWEPRLGMMQEGMPCWEYVMMVIILRLLMHAAESSLPREYQ